MSKNEWIFSVVNDFYEKAKIDILIGYHFRNIKDFDQHIPRIASFWDLQLLGKTEREIQEPFDVIRVHLPLGIKKGELGRWMVLFKQALNNQTDKHSEMKELKEMWLLKLQIFEGIFSRSLGI